MNQRIVEEQNMMKRVSRYILENTITPPIVRVTELTAVINTTITAVDAAASAQVGGTGVAAGGVDAQLDKYAELRSYMKDVARIGRALNRTLYPGVAAQFVLPDSRSYPALIAKARAMIAAATELEEVFVARGLPATFLADLEALVVAFEAGTTMKMDGQQTQVGGTAGLKEQTALGMAAAIELDSIIRAHFRNDPVKLAMWTHARHVKRSNEPGDNDEPETPPDSGSGSGTGSGIAAITGATEGGIAV
jgi:hypothetical protein